MRQLKISQKITSRENESLEKYFLEIGKLDLITADAEAELARRIRQGDEMALEKLVKANLRFVVSVAKQYQNAGLTLGDLINEGNLGLIRAARRFDETRGFKFISYAVWWVRQGIMQSLAEQSRIVRLPLNRVAALAKIANAFSDLEQRFQRVPQHEELAKEIGVSEEELKSNMSLAGRHVSMDAPFVQGEETRLLDVLRDANETTPDSNMMVESLKLEVQRALAKLPDKESQVLKLYYGLNDTKAMTLEEIGYHFSLTKERVRQIKDNATRRMKLTSRCKTLRTYLG